MIEIRSFRDLLRVFFIFKREFVRAALATIVVAVLGAFLLPSRYASDARLLVKATENETITLQVSPSSSQEPVQPRTQRDPLLDEEKMLTSAPVIRQVAKRYLDIQAAAPPPQGLWRRARYWFRVLGQGSVELARRFVVAIGLLDDSPPEDRLAAKLEKAFAVSHDAGSNVLELGVDWADPSVAQQLARIWVDAYFEQRGEATASRRLYDFYEGQSRDLGGQILVLKKQLRDQLQNVDASSVQQELDSLSDQLQRLYKARQDAEGERQSLEGALAEAQAELPSLPAEVVTEREVGINPVRQDLEIRLNDLKAQRALLQRIYVDQAPQIQAIDQSIRSLQGQIDGQRADVQRSQNISQNALATHLRQGMQDSKVRMSQLDAHLAAYDKQIAQVQAQRSRIMAAEPQLAELSLQLSTAEKTFAQYSDYLLRARVIRDLNNNRLSNVTVIEQPTFDPARTFPKNLLLLLAAIPAGLGVGLLTVFLCFLLDQRIHDGGQVEQTFGVPLWATLAEPSAKPKAYDEGLQRICARLPLSTLIERGLTIGLVSPNADAGVGLIAERLQRMLSLHGQQVRVGGEAPAAAGEIVLIPDVPLDGGRPLLELKHANLVLLVLEARRSTVQSAGKALTMLRQALGKVDGIVLNRSRQELPQWLLERLSYSWQVQS